MYYPPNFTTSEDKKKQCLCCENFAPDASDEFEGVGAMNCVFETSNVQGIDWGECKKHSWGDGSVHPFAAFETAPFNGLCDDFKKAKKRWYIKKIKKIKTWYEWHWRKK